MIFPYRVKHNGTWYAVGEDVPTEKVNPGVAKTVEVEVETKVEAAAEVKVEAPKSRGRRKKKVEE